MDIDDQAKDRKLFPPTGNGPMSTLPVPPEPPAPPKVFPKMMNFEKAAEYLKAEYGLEVSPRLVHKWHDEATIATLKIGGIVAVPKASLDSLITSNIRKGH